jgi:hypothetical protein
MSQAELSENPLADRRVRALVGLAGFVGIAVVAVFAIDDPTVQAVALGVGVVDLIATPYILGRLVESAEESSGFSS